MNMVTKYGVTYTPSHAWGMTPRLGPLMQPARPLAVIHHALDPDVACGVGQVIEVAALKQMDTYQVRKFGRFSYQWAVFQSGRIYEGQGWGRIGAHVKGNNSRAYGIVLVINGDRQLPTEAAAESVRALLAAGVQGGFLASDFRTVGHGDVLEGYECPGELVRANFARLFRTAAQDRPTLRQGDRGPEVMELQALLEMPSKHRIGVFGPLTDLGVRTFQRQNGLTVDGVVGPATWAKLLDR